MSFFDWSAASRYGCSCGVRFAEPALGIIPAALSGVDGDSVVYGGVGRRGHGDGGARGREGCGGLGGEW